LVESDHGKVYSDFDAEVWDICGGIYRKGSHGHTGATGGGSGGSGSGSGDGCGSGSGSGSGSGDGSGSGSEKHTQSVCFVSLTDCTELLL